MSKQKENALLAQWQKRNEAQRMGYLMPCYRFRNAKNSDQLAKVQNEVDEVLYAMIDYQWDINMKSRKALLMECVDVQVCMETLMHNLGATEKERKEMRRAVWEKNNARGYYDEH